MLLPLDGHLLYYDDVAADPAKDERAVVLLVHSLVADSGMWAEQLAPLLAAGHRVVRADLRGHGGSRPGRAGLTMQTLAGDLAELCRHLGIGAAHVVGSSLGGMVAQALALDHPRLVRSLLLAGSLPRSPDAEAMWNERVRLVSEAGSCEPLAEPIMARWFPAAFRSARTARWQQLRDTLAATSVDGFLGCAAAIRSFDFTPRLPALRIPVLVACGSDDVSTPAAENQLLASLVPGGRYESIADARHLPNVERPQAFNRLLLDWLDARHARA